LDVSAFEDQEGVDAAVGRALSAGVTRMLCVGAGYGADTARRAVGLADRHDSVWASVGVHPHDAKAWTSELWAELESLAENVRVVALGEMGLDFHYDNSPRDEQREVFRLQLRAADRLGLPVIIHDRSSDGETFRILLEEKSFENVGVVYHCYSGDVASMEEIVARGGYISIPGIVTFKNAGEMRDVARSTPMDRLFIETDSPFLTPVPFRGRRNEPARVVHVAECIAEARSVPLERVQEATWNNASRFFGIA